MSVLDRPLRGRGRGRREGREGKGWKEDGKMGGEGGKEKRKDAF